MKQSNDTTFAPNNISYADGTNVNEQYGINGSLLRRETNRPGSQPETEHYRFGADGNLRMFLPQAFQQNSGMGLSSSR